jgi:8-oxo-dGTP diphosphatase
VTAPRGGYRPSSPEEAEYLASYDARRFAPVAVTVDVVLLTIREGRLSVLLVERDGFPYRGSWAVPGGFIEPDEDADVAARRELAEETGLTASAGHLEQLRTYTAPDRDPRTRVVSVAYVGFLPDLPAPSAGSDASSARWWAVDDLAGGGVGLAFDHDRIVADAVERARAKLEYTSLAASFLEEPFTLADLRRVYEAVWGVALDVGDFRRNVLSTLGFVAPAGEEAGTYRRGPAVTLHPAMLRPGSGTSPA